MSSDDIALNLMGVLREIQRDLARIRELLEAQAWHDEGTEG